jgi:opacity protein-like surface antigen
VRAELLMMEASMLCRFGVFLAAVLVAAAPAAAQDERPVQLTIGGGFTGVYGAGADRLGNGGNFTLGVLFRTSSVVGVQAEYGWNGMKQKQLSIPVFATPADATGVPSDFFADANMQYGAVNLLLQPKTSGKAAPYVVTGVGVYYRPVTISTPALGYTSVCDPYWYVCYPAVVPVEQVVGKRSSTDMGMNVGGGVNFRLAERASIFFEVRYHYIWGPTFNDAQVNPLAASGTSTPTKANGQFLPITVGFRF